MKKKTGRSKKKQTNIRSMTGFGKGSAGSPYGTVVAEIKTLNHKNLSVGCLPFEGLFLLEERVKSVFGSKVVRGKVTVKISVNLGEKGKASKKIRINEKVAKAYLKEAKNLQKKLSIQGRLEMKDILAFPGVIEQVNETKEENMWPYIKKAVKEAVDAVVKYREDEGAKLYKEFLKRLGKIKTGLKNIEKYEKESIKLYRGRLSGKITEATGIKKINKLNLEEEVALFARNCDIAEETCRLGNHVETYSETLRKEEAEAGKKLDFIAQEMHREANTIGSKASDYRISNEVIGIKSEIEKIREQVKNIE